MEPVDLIQELQEIRRFPGPERSYGAQQGKADLQASNSFAFMMHSPKKKRPDVVH